MAGVALLSACTSAQTTSSVSPNSTVKPTPVPKKQVYHYTPADRDCMKRAMYFESQRSSRDGLMAVGTVIMNRLTSEAYPSTICGIVGQEKQFAPGVLTREVKAEAHPELDEAVDAIIRGERNPEVKDAMFFHTAGLKFPYRNMHYVTVAGGNAFYEKRDEDGDLQTPPPKPAEEYVLALVQEAKDPLESIRAKEFDVASIPVSGSVLAAEVPVPVQKPASTVTLYTEAAPAKGNPTAQLILANTKTGDWGPRFDTDFGIKRPAAGLKQTP
jgi:spore germination cell wall hydrolase CwlJ-like protein